MLSPEDEIKIRAERDALHMLTAYLLYERKEETELRTAFAALVMQRHHTFHDKEGEETDFTQCANQICINALAILQNARKARIELNDLSIQLLGPYNLIVRRESKSRICIAYLEDSDVIKPEQTLLRV